MGTHLIPRANVKGQDRLFIFFSFQGLIGFCIGQVKIPDNAGTPLFKKVGGLYIREVILSYFRFNSNKKKYVLQVSDDDVFEEHKETKLEKILLNKQDDKNAKNDTE